MLHFALSYGQVVCQLSGVSSLGAKLEHLFQLL